MLYILGLLDDADIDWLVTVGQAVTVAANESIIREGVPLDSLFLVLEGTVRVTVASQPGQTLATSGPGEVLGEVSMLDSRPPLATVSAVTHGRVLKIPRARLDDRLQRDATFAARFYRTLAVFLAHRLRERTESSQKKATSGRAVDEDELDPELLETASLAGKRFEWILQRLGQS